jgi:(p)ppGpp synthase/HD superfamily hydrolase
MASYYLQRAGWYMANLERAIQIAYEAHAVDEPRRSGEAFVTHPLAVMEQARKLGYPVLRQILAVLHDVPENNKDWTIPRLREEGFGNEVLEPLDLLTRREGEDYMAYIQRLSQHPDAEAVKELDIEHNLGDNPTPKQVKKYREALLYLATKQEVSV